MAVPGTIGHPFCRLGDLLNPHCKTSFQHHQHIACWAVSGSQHPLDRFPGMRCHLPEARLPALVCRVGHRRHLGGIHLELYPILDKEKEKQDRSGSTYFKDFTMLWEGRSFWILKSKKKSNGWNFKKS